MRERKYDSSESGKTLQAFCVRRASGEALANVPVVPIPSNDAARGGRPLLSSKRIAIGAVHPRFCDPPGHHAEPFGPAVHVKRIVRQTERYANLRPA